MIDATRIAVSSVKIFYTYIASPNQLNVSINTRCPFPVAGHFKAILMHRDYYTSAASDPGV